MTLYPVGLLTPPCECEERVRHSICFTWRESILLASSVRTCIVQISLAMGKLKLKVRGEKLPNMDLFSKSDPYLCVYISRSNEEDFHFINRTEVKKDDLNPKWEELLLEHEDINQDNLKAKIKLEVFEPSCRKIS